MKLHRNLRVHLYFGEWLYKNSIIMFHVCLSGSSISHFSFSRFLLIAIPTIANLGFRGQAVFFFSGSHIITSQKDFAVRTVDNNSVNDVAVRIESSSFSHSLHWFSRSKNLFLSLTWVVCAFRHNPVDWTSDSPLWWSPLPSVFSLLERGMTIII